MVQYRTTCGQDFLNYVEAGDYYIHARLGVLDPALMHDAQRRTDR
jgi:hypothetical protein